MIEVLVPLSLSDLVDRIVVMSARINMATDQHLRGNLQRQRDKLQLALEHALPESGVLPALIAELTQIRSDLHVLDADLRSNADRADFGPGFIALSRSRIEQQIALEQIEAKIAAYMALHPAMQMRVPARARSH
ncbi:hypothetical protein [Loktanella agnita]|uniref:hypothetical protein n=1 Tax=Loktanella agnita TaxID=287097 RepID=UPI0039891BE7